MTAMSSSCPSQPQTNIKSKATVGMGEVGNAIVEVMFESGCAVSLLRKSDTNQVDVYSTARATRVRLTTATSEPLPVVGTEQLLREISRTHCPSALPQWSFSWPPRCKQNTGKVARGVLLGNYITRCGEILLWMYRMPASQTAIT